MRNVLWKKKKKMLFPDLIEVEFKYFAILAIPQWLFSTGEEIHVKANKARQIEYALGAGK